MDKGLLKKYAVFAVNTAAALQKGQTLIIRCPVETAYFAHICAKEGYAAGAREVVVHYNDEKLARMKMQHCAVEILEDIKPHIERQTLDYIEGPGSAALLNIIARDPELYKGLDAEKIDRATVAIERSMMNIRGYIMNDRIQWTIVAVPCESWTRKVFPDISPSLAEEKMWEAIFTCSRVSGGEPEKEWAEYIEKTCARREKINGCGFKEIIMTSKNGTDLTVGLADSHVWMGGVAHTPQGVKFIANIPTEEVYTAPHHSRVNGTVYGTKPYVYHGDIIDSFSVTFKDGVVVSHSAKTGGELLQKLLDTDEGSRRIGEIALVGKSSGVNRSGILYYNTLYDENAACHIAFGRAYPTTVKGGEKLNSEELCALGVNESIIHEDVMIGSEDMDIVGITNSGEKVQLFSNGEWVF